MFKHGKQRSPDKGWKGPLHSLVDDPRNPWQIFNKIEQTGKKGGDLNAGAVATCIGTSRRPRSSSTSASSLNAKAEVPLHARLQQNSEGLTKMITRTSKLAQRIHAAEFASIAKSALKLANARAGVSFARSLRQSGVQKWRRTRPHKADGILHKSSSTSIH